MGTLPRDSVGALPAAPAGPEAKARHWLQFMLLGVGAMTLALYTTSIDAQRYQFTSARYLLPLYLSTPILFGFLWRYAAPILRPLACVALYRGILLRTASWAKYRIYRRDTPTPRSPARAGSARSRCPGDTRRRRQAKDGRGGLRGGTPLGAGLPAGSPSVRRPFRAAAVTAAIALVLLCALSLYGGALTFARSFDATQFAQPIVPTDQALLTFLDAHHITAFYSDYWVCYRMTFETDERLLCAVRGQNGDIGLELINNRNDDYIRRMAQVSHPAYILPAGTPEDTHFTAEAIAAGLPYAGYQRALVAGYAVYYHP
ncbi:MAG TPA: hypothetical protein VKT52_02965 [Ktedonobacterales bacterium]|nr:hypothetical protein [Ktedonobacterales bacterium]